MKLFTVVTIAAIAVTSAASAGGLNSFDRNGDGGISLSEFLRVQGPEAGAEMFYHVDDNGDGLIDAGEFAEETNSHGIFRSY